MKCNEMEKGQTEAQITQLEEFQEDYVARRIGLELAAHSPPKKTLIGTSCDGFCCTDCSPLFHIPYATTLAWVLEPSEHSCCNSKCVLIFGNGEIVNWSSTCLACAQETWLLLPAPHSVL